MKCDALWDYLDGDLEASGPEEFRVHLGSCPGCRREMEEYAAVADSLRWEESEEPPPVLRLNLQAEFHRVHREAMFAAAAREKTLKGGWLGWRWAVPAAVVLLLGVLAIYRFSGEAGRPSVLKEAPTATAGESLTYQVYQADGTVRAMIRTRVGGGGTR